MKITTIGIDLAKEVFYPNSAIEFLISPADASSQDCRSESRHDAVDSITIMSIGSLLSVLLAHFNFLKASLSFPR